MQLLYDGRHVMHRPDSAPDSGGPQPWRADGRATEVAAPAAMVGVKLITQIAEGRVRKPRKLEGLALELV